MHNKKIWHRLHNGYWLSVLFLKSPEYNSVWFACIAVAKTRRKINDHWSKTDKSPKRFFNKSTNNKGGLESLRLTLQDMQSFIEAMPNGGMLIVEGSNEQRTHVYSRLLRYGFIQASYYAPGYPCHKLPYYFAEK